MTAGGGGLKTMLVMKMTGDMQLVMLVRLKITIYRAGK